MPITNARLHCEELQMAADPFSQPPSEGRTERHYTVQWENEGGSFARCLNATTEDEAVAEVAKLFGVDPLNLPLFIPHSSFIAHP